MTLFTLSSHLFILSHLDAWVVHPLDDENDVKIVASDRKSNYWWDTECLCISKRNGLGIDPLVTPCKQFDLMSIDRTGVCPCKVVTVILDQWILLLHDFLVACANDSGISRKRIPLGP